jgi:uncharacterized protein (DUF427 family)
MVCNMTKLPTWAELGREGWVNRGERRPHFAVEPGPDQESVWDYPRPPRIVADSRQVIVVFAAVEIARTTNALRVLETSHPPTFYLPREDVRMERLVRVGGGSSCEWKGDATYFDVRVGDRAAPRAAWSYDSPFDDASVLAGHIAFYASLVEATVDGAPVLPQPGRFYGGWITPELVGPFKGEPGSEAW